MSRRADEPIRALSLELELRAPSWKRARRLIGLKLAFSMAHRSFRDEGGREWDVWEVVPTAVERRVAAAVTRPAPVERRKVKETRVVVPDRLQKGWLAFQSGRERRRLAPIPSDWADMTATNWWSCCTRPTGGQGA